MPIDACRCIYTFLMTRLFPTISNCLFQTTKKGTTKRPNSEKNTFYNIVAHHIIISQIN